ncbi:MAG: hypothetical protein H6Q90_2498 [Deltaproteobacteria bacterium]|nr:hypothetical protein [Deltaproteobacteria bacterium]
MQLATWVRTTIWRAEDWCAALGRMADELAASTPAPTTVDRALELARALELIDPDRRRSLAMYLLAWRAGRPDAGDPTRRLAREVRDHAVIAELALADYQATNDAAHLVTAGMTWVDAGTPERAVEPLTQAAVQRPNDQELKSVLAIARREVKDPHREVSRWNTLASASSRADQPRTYLHAARIAHAVKLDEIYGTLLQTAINRRFGGDFPLLFEDRLLARGNVDELLGFYRAELETVTSDRDWVEKVRAAATKLVLRGQQPGLALRLLRSSLAHAYNAKLTDVPGHLASWQLLLGHARQTSATVELMPLLVDALGRTLSDDERVFLSRVGFEISWHDARDVEAARPYATAVAELVPDHPGVCAFMSNELAALLGDEDHDLFNAFEDLGDTIPDEPIAAAAAIAQPAAVEPAPPAPAPPAPTPPAPAPPAPAPPAPAPPAPLAPPVPARRVAPPPPATALRAAGSPRPVPASIGAARPPSPPRAISLIPATALAALRGSGKQVGLPAVPPLRAGAEDRAARMIVPIDLELTVAGGVAFSAVARDISTTGLFVVTRAELALDTVVTIDIRLPGETVLVQARFGVSARVMRRTDAGYGVMFIAPSPELVAAIVVVTASA